MTGLGKEVPELLSARGEYRREMHSVLGFFWPCLGSDVGSTCAWHR